MRTRLSSLRLSPTRETIGLIGAGLALGAGLAYAASRLIDSRLYGVAAQDPLTLALATGLLLLLLLVARCRQPVGRYVA